MEDEKATALFNLITQFAISKATTYAKAGVDILSPGDDISTQNSLKIDVGLWKIWRLLIFLGYARDTGTIAFWNKRRGVENNCFEVAKMW